jgi:membrane-associated protein
MINIISFVLHIDKYISILIQNYGNLVYLILLLIVFCETGLVVIPFLPGDSLLFAAGAFAASGSLKITLLYFLFIAAAFLGDTVNYHIGYYIGPKAFKSNSKLLKKEHLERTYEFYKKHGGKTIIIARFMPIIRTFAPFVAGIGKMGYSKFISYNLIGGILWVTLILFAGYYFGNMPIVKDNFSMVVYGIIIVSILPGIIGFIRGAKISRLSKERS